MSYESMSKRNRISLKQLLARGDTPSVAPEVKTEEKSVFKTPEEIKPPNFVVPADVTAQAAHDLLNKHPAFADIAATKIGTSAWKHSYTAINVGYDKVCLAHLYKAYTNKSLSVGDRNKLEQVMLVARNYLCCNGSLRGLIHRMVTSLPKVEPVLKPKQDVLDFVGSYLIFQPDVIPDTIDFEDETIFDLVPSADAGFPFVLKDPLAKTETCLVKAVEMAKKYIKILSTDDDTLTNTIAYFKAHPNEIRFMLKRKHERMKLENFEKKVRPYYVPPLALKLIFIWVAFFVQGAMKNYQEINESISAYKTSWFYGGTTKFIDIVIGETVKMAIEDKRFIFRSVCYGDDNYWVLCFPDGSHTILAPDINAMDMNNPSICGILLRQMFKDYYVATHDVEPPVFFMKALHLLVILAYKTPTHMFASFAMQIRWGKRAGIPLTTVLDMVCSGLIQGTASQIADQVFAKCNSNTEEKFPEMLDQFKKILRHRVQSEISCTFKEETLDSVNYTSFSSVNEYSLPFLGYTFKYYTGTHKSENGDIPLEGWIPIPKDMAARIVSYVWPMRRLKGLTATNENTMERIYGLVLSGVWHDELLYSVLRDHYVMLQNAGVSISDVDSIPPGFEDIEDMVSVHPDLPSRDMIAAMYILPVERFSELLKSAVPTSPQTKVVDYAPIESLDTRLMNEASTMFASVAISKKHAGKVKLPPSREELARREQEKKEQKQAVVAVPRAKIRDLSSRQKAKKTTQMQDQSVFDDFEDEPLAQYQDDIEI